MALKVGRVPRRGARECDEPQDFEAAVHEALLPLAHEDLSVSFGVYEDDEGSRICCRVETPPGDPMSDAPPWRFWSALVRDTAELRRELSRAVDSRLQAYAVPPPQRARATVAAGGAATAG